MSEEDRVNEALTARNPKGPPRSLTENENLVFDAGADAEMGNRVTGPGNGTCAADCPGGTLIRSNAFRGEQGTGGSVYPTHVTRTYICSACRRPVAWTAEHPGHA